jgi:hypothetical protein
MLAGVAGMAVCLMALDRVADLTRAVPLIAPASASWPRPTANAYPLFVEPIPRQHRGAIAAPFVLAVAGGAIGDPLNRALFDLFGSYRPLFAIMAAYPALGFSAVLWVPRGVGEAGTCLATNTRT